jgi:UDP-2,4-diacetamido-2,4,6-trideoxy-beta-L-altropyranose hydrolase
MKSKIFIRADGNTKIGLGHLTRCMALAKMLNHDFQIIFVSKEIPEHCLKQIQHSLFGFNKIESENDFFNKLKPEDIVIIDGYHFDTDYQKRIKRLRCKLVCIDDLHDKEFVADLIINQAPGISPSDYSAQPYTQFALGLDYVLLRPVFLEQAKKERKVKKTETILICFGGSDIKNLTESTLSIVSTFKEFKQIIVITGASYPYSKTLHRLIKKDKKILHYHAVEDSELLHLMLKADLAIVPASGILFETLSTGCKVISGYYINNQMEIYKGLLELKSIFDAKDFSSENLITSLNTTSDRPIIRLIDGESSLRLLKKIKNLYNVC